MQDSELAKAVLSGDPEAGRRFDDLYRSRLYKAAVYMLGYRDPEAEDAVQETFVIALSKLGEYDARRAGLYTWMSGICVNVCYRRIAKRRRYDLDSGDGLEAHFTEESRRRHHEDQAADERQAMLAELERHLEGMDEPCRTILHMRHKRGASYAAISKAAKIPIGTVMSRLSRCRDVLKGRLTGAVGGGVR